MFTFETRGTETRVDPTAETVRRIITQVSELNRLFADEDEAETEAKAKGRFPSSI